MRFRSAIAIALGALLSVAVASALAAPKTGKYTGTNSQQPAQPLTFHVSNKGKDVLDFSPTFVVNCTRKGLPPKTVQINTDAGTNIPIKSNAFKLKSNHARIHNANAVFAVGSLTLSGSFPSKHTAKGSYTVSFTFNHSAPSGFPGYHCATGKVRWTAAHA